MGLEVGAEDLTGVDDRGGGACDLERIVARDVGVEGLLVVIGPASIVGRPVGVAGVEPL